MKRLLCGLLLVLLSACSATTLTRQQTGEVHKIGIISAIGDELNIRSFMPDASRPDGLLDRGSITDLALDAYVVEQATARLKDKYDIIPIAYQPGVFHQTETEQSLHANAVQGRSLGQVIRATTQLPTGMAAGTESSVDIYLVFLSGHAKLQNGDHSLYGTSLSRLPAADGAPSYNLGVVYWIAVIDGHTLQSIGNVNTLSDHAVDPALWADKVAALTADQKRQLAGIWQKRIDLTLAPALRKLNLLEE
ncbi:MAG TPA: hypothetical protein VM639_13750 [Dongiaceae bacterium]|nr:hypothetical protein [Dongiaceae bacterium]